MSVRIFGSEPAGHACGPPRGEAPARMGLQFLEIIDCGRFVGQDSGPHGSCDFWRLPSDVQHAAGG